MLSVSTLIDWCLTPTLAVIQLYRMSVSTQQGLKNTFNHIIIIIIMSF